MLAPLQATAAAPAPPRTHARYGPLTACFDGYGFSADASEAISVSENSMSLGGDSGGMSLNREALGPDRSQARVSAIDIDAIGRVIRYENVRYGSAGTGVEYLLPARTAGAPLVVRSFDFDGSNRDLAMLGRVSRMDPHSPACHAFAAPGFEGEDVSALYWSPVTATGPIYHCQNGIGLQLRAGDTLQYRWRPSMPWTIPASRVTTGGIRLTWDGPITYRNASNSAPLADYRRSVGQWSGRWILSLWPPQQAMSREALRALPRDQYYTDGIQIEFPAGQEAAAREFATRLEFVDRADPRCLPD
jgi:hypothetical protein